jgi:hypothetical protein
MGLPGQIRLRYYSAGDIGLTIEAYTTYYHENMTQEFRPTKGQMRRVSEVQDEWQHDTLEIKMFSHEFSSDPVWEVISHLVDTNAFPIHDSDGEHIFYQLAKLQTDTFPLQPKNGLALTLALSSNLPLKTDESLAQQGIKDGDQLILYPGLKSGGPDPLTIAAGIATITQVVLMVVDLWSRRSKEAKSKQIKEKEDKTKRPSSKAWDEVKEIRIEMSDRTWVQFNSWLTNPDTIRNYLDVFNLPSESPKPVRVVFVLKNGTKAQLIISSGPESKQHLDKFLKFLML